MTPATVTDKKKSPIEDLTSADFEVLDDGVPQNHSLHALYTEVAPIALAIAIQSSGISDSALGRIRKVGSMIQPMVTGPHGFATIASFDQQTRWIQPWTRDPDAISNAFHSVRTSGHKQACLLDTAHDAIRELSRHQRARRILLLISESRDRSSETDLGTVILAAQTENVTVYSATFSAFKTAMITKSPQPTPAGSAQVDILGGMIELGRLGKTKTTKALAEATGGATYSFTRLDALEKAIEQLGSELHSQYVLSFTPDSPKPGYHRLEVRITCEGKYNVRARPGYWVTAEL